MIASICGAVYPSFFSAIGTVWLTIFINPPPTSFLYLTSAMSGSTPVVSQSIMKPMVPVGASTVACALRYPNSSPRLTASSQDALAVRSEEHTSELQSRQYLVCRLLLEKKNKNQNRRPLH